MINKKLLMNYLNESSNLVIVSDFDGTLTNKDTIRYLLQKYGKDEWINVQREIDSKKIESNIAYKKLFDCLEIEYQEAFNEVYKNIKLDNYFNIFYDNINEKGIDLFITSNGVEQFILRVLKKSFDSKKIPIFSNRFLIGLKSISVEKCWYPAVDDLSMKASIVYTLKKNGKKILFIGDGKSDFEAASYADIVFAKNDLADMCDIHDVKYNNFSNVKDVNNYLENYLTIAE